ncbi:hypothetical protein D9M70_623600 [compost metagenome]
MARTVLARDIAIIFRALIGVFDHHRNWRAGGGHGHTIIAQQYAGQHAHLIRLAALCCVFRLAGLALVEIGLDFGFREGDAGKAAIHHTTKRRTVAFAPGCYAEEMTKTVMRHC